MHTRTADHATVNSALTLCILVISEEPQGTCPAAADDTLTGRHAILRRALHVRLRNMLRTGRCLDTFGHVCNLRAFGSTFSVKMVKMADKCERSFHPNSAITDLYFAQALNSYSQKVSTAHSTRCHPGSHHGRRGATSVVPKEP